MEEGLKKLLCVFQMGNHFRAQVHPSDYHAAGAVTSAGLKRFAALVVNEDVPPDWLARFEAALPAIQNTWEEQSQLLYKVERLYIESTNRGPLARVSHALDRTRRKYVKLSYFALLAESRAVRIILELRRHKDATGAWPANLAEIENRVAPEAPLRKRGKSCPGDLEGPGVPAPDKERRKALRGRPVYRGCVGLVL